MDIFGTARRQGPVDLLHMPLMSEERLVEIEIKMAHFEMLIDELNLVITKQQKTIDLLENAMRAMANKSIDGDEKQKPIHLKPPHY